MATTWLPPRSITYARSGNEVTLTPHNPILEPMVFTADQVEVYGKVVTVMRRY